MFYRWNRHDFKGSQDTLSWFEFWPSKRYVHIQIPRTYEYYVSYLEKESLKDKAILFFITQVGPKTNYKGVYKR